MIKWTRTLVDGKTPIELIRLQLEDWAKDDAALAAKFDPARLDDCWAAVEEKARERLNGKSGAVYHDDVFRWARDFYVDDPDAVAPALPAEPAAAPVNPDQLDLFAEASE